ncbi:MAG: hypothetical protein L0H41_01375 [Microlunatus sp.]|nr:hypothetical protein [Microlunatus sp.]MDN5770848.1 hypothetical protein [Microlunatus sp.]
MVRTVFRVGRATAHRIRAIVIAGTLMVVGVLNLLPGVVLVAPGRLGQLYGLSGLDEDLLVLLRHRAMLLALVGGFLIAALVRPGWRQPALLAGLLSNVAFVLLVLAAPTSAEISRVASIDLALLPLLGCALALDVLGARRRSTDPAPATADV